MSQIVTKPYEIVLRFGCELGDTAGQLRGVSLAQKQFIVDDAGKITARVDSGREDDPKAFPADQIEKYLGAQFAEFEKQHRDALGELEAAAARIHELEAELKDE